MHHPIVRTLGVASLVLALMVGLALPASAQAVFPTTIPLPDGFAPEGIARGPGSTMFAGSLSFQGIYQFSARTGQGEIIVEGIAGQPFVGLKYDARSGHLFVAGGPNGTAFIFDAATGDLVAEFDLVAAAGGTVPAPNSFINDVVVTQSAAYFTDSMNARFFVIPLARNGQVTTGGVPFAVPLSGDWEQVDGFNANGIAASANGRTLIIVNSTTGTLYTVEPATGEATAIDLDGETVTMGDGILLSGLTLYVVRNRANEVAVVRLASDFGSGTIVQRVTDPLFRVPTTVAQFGNALYVVNARFGTEVTPTTDYDAVRFIP
jgi:hypothetical protein